MQHLTLVPLSPLRGRGLGWPKSGLEVIFLCTLSLSVLFWNDIACSIDVCVVCRVITTKCRDPVLETRLHRGLRQDSHPQEHGKPFHRFRPTNQSLFQHFCPRPPAIQASSRSSWNMLWWPSSKYFRFYHEWGRCFFLVNLKTFQNQNYLARIIGISKIYDFFCICILFCIKSVLKLMRSRCMCVMYQQELALLFSLLKSSSL